MAIKKRTIPKRPKPRKKKLSPHQRRCRDLYNRLQDGDDYSITYCVKSINNALGWRPTSTYLFIEALIARVSTEIATLQINHPDHISYRVTMQWEDRDSKPKYGYRYSTLAVVKTSPRLVQTVMLCYIELCKNAGKWI